MEKELKIKIISKKYEVSEALVFSLLPKGYYNNIKYCEYLNDDNSLSVITEEGRFFTYGDKVSFGRGFHNSLPIIGKLLELNYEIFQELIK